MGSLAQRDVYPNPATAKTWCDGAGRTWWRRTDRLGGLHAKRTRSLLRRSGVALVTWWAGDVEWFDDASAKQAAASDLYQAVQHPDDIVAWEWKAEDGTRMLMLEHHC